ncbi:MAG: sigma-54-dependent Fis family transcriptional regulator [Deltaproteobacteria bacterium]|nr:sigma-54-dependent Fis family transcriptional regulator [Deltaproteobacteria bacterium]
MARISRPKHDVDSPRGDPRPLHARPVPRLRATSRREHGDPTTPWRRMLSVENVVGCSRALAEVFRLIAVAAPTRVSILVTGPSGTGKNEVAHSIHTNSHLRAGPFVEVNCGAIPVGLVESEFFGALPGSFTSANHRIRGKVEAARGGTLFLDEVCELPFAVQAKLLTLLSSGHFYPVGGSCPILADIRVVAATNQDPESAVAERRLREDLFHRLNAVRIHLPPLNDRPEDLLPLALHFVTVTCRRERVSHIPLEPEACRAIQRARWPGNARQLRNTVEWAVLQAMSETAQVIGVRHLFPANPPEAGSETPSTWREATRVFQRRFLLDTLAACGQNRSEAARRLGLSRSHLYEILVALDIKDGS